MFDAPGSRRKYMSRTRLFSPVPLSADTDVTLVGDQARYIGRVLRLKPGDGFTIFDGKGGEYPATVATISKTQVEINVAAIQEQNAQSPLAIHLLQGVSRGERMDFVVQKATELGVQRITPVLTEFSVVKLDPKRAKKRVQHWSNIAISACEQCGRNILPHIDAPQPLRNWFGDNLASTDTRILLRPEAESALVSISAPASDLVLLVGPEGGFSDAEYEHAEIAGFKAASFGPRILRTETAAIAAIAVLQSLHGDLTNN
jgi:16S rRNA (uracil1498-N3)-methyltransferase